MLFFLQVDAFAVYAYVQLRAALALHLELVSKADKAGDYVRVILPDGRAVHLLALDFTPYARGEFDKLATLAIILPRVEGHPSEQDEGHNGHWRLHGDLHDFPGTLPGAYHFVDVAAACGVVGLVFLELRRERFGREFSRPSNLGEVVCFQFLFCHGCKVYSFDLLGRCLPRMAKEIFCLEKSETAGAICVCAGLFWPGCTEYVCICVACFLVRLTLFNGNNLQKVL